MTHTISLFLKLSVYAFCTLSITATTDNDTTPSTTDDKETTASSAYALLRRDLMSREAVTDKVPPGGGKSRVTVDVVFTPIDILDVDDVRQVVTSAVVLAISWTDPTLAWNATAGPYAGLQLYTGLELPAQVVWRPFVMIVNGASDTRTLDTVWGDRAAVMSSGTVSIVSSPVLSFTCKMDLRVYPFDTQKCVMVLYIFSTVGVNARHIESETFGSQIVRDAFTVMGEWTLVSLSVDQKKLSTLEDVYLEYTWVLKRKMTFFVVSFIAPIVMSSYMNVLVFIIPAESGEKISYLVSIFVSNAVFVSFCTNEMPQGLDSTPLVMYLILGIMAESGVLVIINSLILRRYHRNEKSSNTQSTSGRRPLSANSVRPFQGGDLDDKLKELSAPDYGAHTSGKVTPTEISFFVGAFILNTIFVVSLLAFMYQ